MRPNLCLIWEQTRHPVPGMPITVFIGRDRYPGTIHTVTARGRFFTYRKDCAIARIDSYAAENQAYLFIPDDTAALELASRGADGRYQVSGKPWTCIGLGARAAYFDPTFPDI